MTRPAPLPRPRGNASPAGPTIPWERAVDVDGILRVVTLVAELPTYPI